MRNVTKVALAVPVGLLAVFLALQLVPFERADLNPSKRIEPEWDDPRTRELAVRACFDCHSNDTTWPWYSRIAPLSWRVHDHVIEGREHLNFSEWDREYKDADEAGEVLENGEMPLWDYVWMHPEAKLTDDERDALVRGLEKSLGIERW